MESDPPKGKQTFRYVNIKNGLSPNYMCNNMVKSDTFVAMVKNTFSKSKIVIYKLEDLEN